MQTFVWEMGEIKVCMVLTRTSFNFFMQHNYLKHWREEMKVTLNIGDGGLLLNLLISKMSIRVDNCMKMPIYVTDLSPDLLM